MSNPYVIGISGTAGAGKDTLGLLLNDLNINVKLFAFAQQLKRDLDPFLLKHFKISAHTDNRADKEIIRPILISYGCAQRAVDIQHWTKKVNIQINDRLLKYPDTVAVVTDHRFESEVEYMRGVWGSAFKLINVTRKGAQSPTSEEEKHYRQVAEMADYELRWGYNTPAEQLGWAREVMGWLGLPHT